MHGAPALSAVVVAWNSADALPACIGALRRSAALADAALEVVVVDNASADGSRTAAADAGADTVLANPLNAGYGVAAAQGLAVSSAPWVLLANPDLVVAPSFVSALLAAGAEAPSEVATLVPDIRFASDPAIVNVRGVAVDAAGVPADAGLGERAAPLDGLRPVFGGSSGGCAFRREALAAVGGLEPAFFAYLEDVDLAWRLQRAGFGALLVPGAVALHEGSASTGSASPLRAYLVARNRRLLFRLHGPHSLRARARRTLVEAGHLAVVTASGAGVAAARGRLAALRSRPYTGFVRRSLAAQGLTRTPPLPAPAGLRETLRRKRAAERHMHGGPAAGAAPEERSARVAGS